MKYIFEIQYELKIYTRVSMSMPYEDIVIKALEDLVKSKLLYFTFISTSYSYHSYIYHVTASARGQFHLKRRFHYV